MKQHPSALQTTEEICKDIMLEQVDKVIDMQSARDTSCSDNLDQNHNVVNQENFVVRPFL